MEWSALYVLRAVGLLAQWPRAEATLRPVMRPFHLFTPWGIPPTGIPPRCCMACVHMYDIPVHLLRLFSRLLRASRSCALPQMSWTAFASCPAGTGGRATSRRSFGLSSAQRLFSKTLFLTPSTTSSSPLCFVHLFRDKSETTLLPPHKSLSCAGLHAATAVLCSGVRS